MESNANKGEMGLCHTRSSFKNNLQSLKELFNKVAPIMCHNVLIGKILAENVVKCDLGGVVYCKYQ